MTVDKNQLANVDITYDVELYEALKRLEQNEDFKKVVLDDYCKKYALGRVSLLGVPGYEGPIRAKIMEELVSISNLMYHFGKIKNLGSTAKEDLVEENTND